VFCTSESGAAHHVVLLSALFDYLPEKWEGFFVFLLGEFDFRAAFFLEDYFGLG
jgi:hypothetical protein